MVSNWEVAKPQGICAGCGLSLQPKQEYYAALIEQEARTGGQDQPGVLGGFRREDYCLGCWEHWDGEVFCFWKSCLAEPAEKKKLLVDDEVLLNFFERLSEADAQVKINFRFVLALILMRKRILKYQHTDLRDGQEVWIMGQVRQQTIHEVLNPRLDDAQIEEVSEQLSAVLQSEL